MAQAVRCDACGSVNARKNTFYIKLFSVDNKDKIYNYKHGIKNADNESAVDLCKDCFNKVLSIVTKPKEVDNGPIKDTDQL